MFLEAEYDQSCAFVTVLGRYLAKGSTISSSLTMRMP